MRRSILEQANSVLERTPEARARQATAEGIATLGSFRHALVLGRLHTCCNCSHFGFATDRGALGACRRYQVEAWAFVPFKCDGFEISRTPVAPELIPDPDGGAARSREYMK